MPLCPSGPPTERAEVTQPHEGPKTRPTVPQALPIKIHTVNVTHRAPWGVPLGPQEGPWGPARGQINHGPMVDGGAAWLISTMNPQSTMLKMRPGYWELYRLIVNYTHLGLKFYSVTPVDHHL